MKQRILSLILISALLLAGCEEKLPPVSENDRLTPTIVPNAYVKPTEETSETEPPITAGGYPWLDTNLKENLTEGMELSPKDDFYLYVNYDWLMNAEIPDGYAALEEAVENLEDQAKAFMALLDDQSVTGHDADLMRDVFRVALDWDARNADGIQPMMKTMEDIRNIQNLDELKDFLCDPDKTFKVPTFVEFENVVRADDPSRYLFAVMTAKLILEKPEEYEARTEIGDRAYEAAKEFVMEMLSRAGYDGKDAEKAFEAAIKLETKLAKGMKESGNAMLYEQVEGKKTYYKAKFPLMDMIDAYGYGEATECVCENLQYLDNLDKIFKKSNLEEIKDYLVVKFVMNASTFLDKESYLAHSRYSNKVYGREGQTAYETLIYYNLLNSVWGDLMTRTYLQKNDMAQEKERITSLIRNVIDGYREMLRNEDWLSEETKAKAIRKLDQMIIKAGYPDQLRDYGSVDAKGLNYWEFGKLNSRLKREFDVAHTNGTVDKMEWTASALIDNACYTPKSNSITIPIGSLLTGWYYEGISDEELYARLGTTIGHEISHAFDSNGATRDENGQRVVWWTDADKEAFEGRMAKLRDYFKNVTIWEGAPVRAEQICDEACADLGGLKVILGLAQKQENFDYDKFFKAYAQSGRALETVEYRQYNNLRSEHLAWFLRVNSTVQQFEEFMKTYDVQEGDRMYLAPEDRALVW